MGQSSSKPIKHVRVLAPEGKRAKPLDMQKQISEVVTLLEQGEINILEIREVQGNFLTFTFSYEDTDILKPLIDTLAKGGSALKELRFITNKNTNLERLSSLLTALIAQTSFETLALYLEPRASYDSKTLGTAVAKLLLQGKLRSLSLQGRFDYDFWDALFSTELSIDNSLKDFKIEIPFNQGEEGENENFVPRLSKFVMNNIGMSALTLCYAGYNQYFGDVPYEKMFLLYAHPRLEKFEIVKYKAFAPDEREKELPVRSSFVRSKLAKDLSFDKLREKVWKEPYEQYMEARKGPGGQLKLFRMACYEKDTDITFNFELTPCSTRK